MTAFILITALLGVEPRADGTAQSLPFSQNWSNTGLITVNDDWSGVPGIVGYRGDNLTAATGVDPQTVLADGTGTPVDVNANQTNPDTFTTGGVAEFHLVNPTIALNGSGTADAPFILISLNTTGSSGIQVSYNLRDLDGSADNAVQQVALHYRVGSSGNFTNVPAAYVADATTGPNLATLVSPVSVTLPAAVDNQPLVQLRIMTTNAVGNDEWVGIDDLSVSAAVSSPTSPSGTGLATPSALFAGGNTLLTVAVTPGANPPSTGLAVAADLSPIGSSSTQTFFDNGTNGDVTAGDNVFTYLATVAPATPAGSKNLPVTITDAEARSGSTSIALTVLVRTPIHTIQGAGHLSPLTGQVVLTSGIVTVVRSNGFYLQEPDATVDADSATSEGIFVFTSSAPTVSVGDAIQVIGTVSEFRPGGGSTTNLTTTELTSPSISVLSAGNPLPAATVIGTGGRIPPATVIEDDAAGDVEATGVFDPATDGIDFYESLEGMRVQVNNAVAVGPTSAFGELPIVGDNGANAGVSTPRGGVVIQSSDFNPERIILDDVLVFPVTMPSANVGDGLGTVSGVIDYSFGNFKLLVTSAPVPVPGPLAPETATATGPNELGIATFNVENLDPGDPPSRFSALASLVVNNLRSPDIIAVEEIQDNNGPTNDGTVDASATYGLLITAITAAGGPPYGYRQIDPQNNQDGGEPGANIRQAFLFRTDRGLQFVDRPGGTATAATTVVGSGSATQLSFSPGRIDPTNSAFVNSRKPLAGEFLFKGHRLFVVANHFQSKGGDDPLFGRYQPPQLTSELQRLAQAQVVNDFVDALLAADPAADVVVLGDLNDYQFSAPLGVLEGSPAVLNTLTNTLPVGERYTYVFDGNSQALDHILLSNNLFATRPFSYDIVHANAEFAVRSTDHDPALVRLTFTPALSLTKAPTPTTYDHVGQVISYVLTATNAGDVPLTNVMISDVSLTLACSPAQPAALQPGDSLTCSGSRTVSQADLDVGGLTNTAGASSSFGSTPIDALPVTVMVQAVQIPRLSLSKTATPSVYNAAGEAIAYDYVVLNSGNVTLAGPVTVSDSHVTVTCPPAASVAPGASIVCTATYVIKASDVTARSVTNTATASASFNAGGVTSTPAVVTITYVKPVRSTTQKGSLLLFPDIDVRGSVTTIVRIQNDATKGVWVKCHFMDGDKRRNDFAFLVTRGQPVWFDAATGAGTADANPFPSGYGAGLLTCFAVDAEERQQIKWNHLSGSATVVDYGEGTAYEYSAAVFYGYPGLEGAPIAPPAGFALPAPCDATQVDCTPTAAEGDQVLGLDGKKYDYCPATLIGQFSPEGAAEGDQPLGKDLAEFGRTRAVFVGCNLDLRQAYQRYDTKLTFDVWNEDELKLTGAHDCADGWHETWLTDVKAQGDNFTLGDLKTEAARYRVSGVRDDFACAPRKTARVGLVGVQSTDVTLSGGGAKVGSSLTAVGYTGGFIVWTPQGVIDEGGVR